MDLDSNQNIVGGEAEMKPLPWDNEKFDISISDEDTVNSDTDTNNRTIREVVPLQNLLRTTRNELSGLLSPADVNSKKRLCSSAIKNMEVLNTGEMPIPKKTNLIKMMKKRPGIKSFLTK